MMTPSPNSVATLQVTEWNEGHRRLMADDLVGEEPLEIRINDVPVSVTLRTPGDDEELAVGFLLTEGVIMGRGQIADITVTEAIADGGPEGGPAGAAGREQARLGNVVNVTLSPNLRFDAERLRRNFFMTSSCGVCGKASIDAVRVRGMQAPSRGFTIDPAVLCRLPDTLRASQAIFGRTGGLHAAATFHADGSLVMLREDVGRHNAVDKIVGQALLAGHLPLERQVLLVSGRGGFELVQKAVMAGAPIMASVSAPSSLAVRLARELGLTLVGFLRGRRFIIYSGEERIG
jgi:FdhD protein